MCVVCCYKSRGYKALNDNGKMVINDKVDNDLKGSVLCLFQAIVPELASKY
jgi:hypothetical protein